MGEPHDDQAIGRQLRRVLDPVAPLSRTELPELVAGWIELQGIGEVDAWLLVAASPPLPSRALAVTLQGHPAISVVGTVDDQIAAALVDGRSGDWSDGIGTLMTGSRPVEVAARSLSADDDPAAVLGTLADALRARVAGSDTGTA